MNTFDKDIKYLGRDVTPVPLEVVRTEGNYIFDKKGDKYLDFEMGWCVGNMGWNEKPVIDAIKKFTDVPNYVIPGIPGYMYEPWTELAELLSQITPGNLTKCFRATGGTEAVEIALQAAMSHTKRSKFISIEGSYHGHSIGAMSVGMSYWREKYPNLLDGCYKINPPLNEKAAEEVEKLLATKEIAAYISEPIVLNAGVEIPEKEFLERVYRACKKYGTVFIMDEVATGFGRTGKLFGSEYFDIQPDIMTLAKGLTGGHTALATTIMTEEIAKSMEWEFSFYSTFGWNPLATVITLANVKHILANKERLLANVSQMEKYFKERLEQMNFPTKATVRIKGMAIVVRFEKEGYVYDLANRAFENKLLIQGLDPFTLTIFPTLTIDMETAKEGLDLLEKSL